MISAELLLKSEYLGEFDNNCLPSPLLLSHPPVSSCPFSIPSLTPFSHSPPIPHNPHNQPPLHSHSLVFPTAVHRSWMLLTDARACGARRQLKSRALPTIALGLTAHARTGSGWSWCIRYKYKDKCTGTTTNKTNTQLIHAPNHRIWITWYK